MKTKNMTTLHLRKSLSRSPLRRAFLLILLLLACFGLAPASRALSPAPDGGYASGNTAEGTSALFSLTTGTWNTGLGFSTLFFNATGNFNTAEGYSALFSNTTGGWNTANGVRALFNNTTGRLNTATGAQALFSNTSANDNTATGFEALFGNTTGFQNTATGSQALRLNTTGNANTATGANALSHNTIGDSNTANGFDALEFNTTGFDNTANGLDALLNNTTGSFNTVNGADALLSNTTGVDNTANGFSALQNNITGTDNTAEGFEALVNSTGNSNIAIGSNAGSNLTTGNNNIDIGAPGVAGESNKIRIGKVGTQTATFVVGIAGVAVTGSAVLVSSGGQLGVAASSARFKDEIKPMEKASEAILALKPVTFRYKREIDPEGTSQFGLVAEEVERVNPALVTRDPQGSVFTVRYEAVNAMLLNEFLKEHRKVEQQERKLQEQEATIAQLKKDFRATVSQLTAHLREQDSKIQKVSARLEVSKPAPQIVDNRQ